MTKSFAAPLLLFVFALCSAVVSAAESGPFQRIEVLDVKSAFSREPMAFTITLPPSYRENKDKRYAVLFDFHPRSRAYLDGMHDWMSHNGDWPWLETIIVTAPDGNKALGQLKTLAIEEQGNTQLLDFMQQLLLPAIDAKYRTNGFRIMNGFTGNAGLVLYTLLNRPELFNAYFAASPVLSGDFAYVVKEAPKKLAAMSGKPRFLLMSTSDSDFEQRQLADFALLEQVIEANPNTTLNYKIKRFDGSYYMTQPILATAYGIEWLFDDYHRVLKPDSEVSKQGADAIIAHYQFLSKQKYGFKVPSTDSLIALADAEFAIDSVRGLSVYQAAVAANPDSHTAHDALAGAYGKMKQFDKAIEYEKLALKHTNHPFWTQKYSDRLATFEAEK
ncbi:alpha/beta hydrolase-fold protein [Shewanella psychrotolerans]|uniref:alpha/beta hydrolase-fold protein n=1 Tax=Shewanella psychrotolerans TaxID=2864206 RepID=UPI001C65CCC8|nr:alpha/beta hydrolase-fold protein [Shewanella psychrotolerans]QYK01356.1 hypothetical protein K0I62_18745 [Shewanella psychrotolerans]